MAGLNDTFSRRKSLAFIEEMMPNTINDDKTERNKYREQITLQKQLSIVYNSSLNNSTSEETEVSKETFKTYLHMHANNKINTRNAWDLHVIEFIRSIVKKQSDDKDDLREMLQIAGTSLDIGAKVYGLRVDDVHNETLKLANKLTTLNIIDDGAESGDEQDEGKANKPVRKKKRNPLLSADEKRMTVVENEESLNGVLEKFHALTSSSSENSFLTLTLPKAPGCRYDLVVPERMRNYSEECHYETNAKLTFHIPFQISPNLKNSICPAFRGFAVDVVEENQIPMEDGSEQVDCDENGLPAPVIDMENDAYDDFIEEDVAAQKGIPDELYITDMCPIVGKAYTGTVLEYSYRLPPQINEQFKIIGAWTGPSHWKLKTLRRHLKPAQTNEEKCKKQPKSKVTYKDIHFRGRVWDEWDELLRIRGKKTSILLTNSVEACTLPKKIIVDDDFFQRLFLFPQYKLNIQENNLEKLNISVEENNSFDAEYCSLLQDDFLNDNFNSENEGVPEEIQNSFEESDIIAALDLPINPLPYAIRPTKMDMKKLKICMWEEIVGKGTIKLSSLYVKIPEKLPENSAKNLSGPLAFVALLHLANEHNLQIISSNNNLDLIITETIE